MKIHDILLRASRPYVGQFLSTHDIQSLAFAYDSRLKPGSFLPSEHARALAERCKRCRLQPVFAQASFGLYEVLPVDDDEIEMTTHDVILLALADRVGREMSTAEIKAQVMHFRPAP